MASLFEDESEPEYETPVKKLKIMSKNNPIQPKKIQTTLLN